MAREKKLLLSELSRCVRDMEDEQVSDVAREYAAAGYDPQEGVLNGLVPGMNEAGDRTVTNIPFLRLRSA